MSRCSLWSRAEGSCRAVMAVRLAARSAEEPAALPSPLIPSCSLAVLHKNTKMCSWQRSTCHPLPVPSLEKKPLLSSGSRALPQHFIKCTGLSCCATVSVLLKEMFKQQRGVSLFLCWLVLLFFPPEVQVVCI